MPKHKAEIWLQDFPVAFPEDALIECESAALLYRKTDFQFVQWCYAQLL